MRRSAVLLLALLLAGGACAGGAPAASPAATGASSLLTARLVDVRTGEAFTLGGAPGSVTIVQGMAVW